MSQPNQNDALVLPKKGPQNVVIWKEGNFLFSKIDLSKPIGKTGNGKATLVATTTGVATLADGHRVNINVTRD
jgi:energy-coupling factor transporter ATP-binding protein EcfA2